MDGSSSLGGDHTFLYCYPYFPFRERLSMPRNAEGEFAFGYGVIAPGSLMRLKEGWRLLKLYHASLRPRVSFYDLVSSISRGNAFRCVSGEQRQCTLVYRDKCDHM